MISFPVLWISRSFVIHHDLASVGTSCAIHTVTIVISHIFDCHWISSISHSWFICHNCVLVYASHNSLCSIPLQAVCIRAKTSPRAHTRSSTKTQQQLQLSTFWTLSSHKRRVLTVIYPSFRISFSITDMLKLFAPKTTVRSLRPLSSASFRPATVTIVKSRRGYASEAGMPLSFLLLKALLRVYRRKGPSDHRWRSCWIRCGHQSRPRRSQGMFSDIHLNRQMLRQDFYRSHA